MGAGSDYNCVADLDCGDGRQEPPIRRERHLSRELPIRDAAVIRGLGFCVGEEAQRGLLLGCYENRWVLIVLGPSLDFPGDVGRTVGGQSGTGIEPQRCP